MRNLIGKIDHTLAFIGAVTGATLPALVKAGDLSASSAELVGIIVGAVVSAWHAQSVTRNRHPEPGPGNGVVESRE